MGVPKFFRWLSERYPKINQRYGSLPDPDTCERYFGKAPPPTLEQPDPLSQCGLAPEIDRLYLDMNGIIHGCSHNNSPEDDETEASATSEASSTKRIPQEEIFRNVCYYLDRVIGDIAQPNQLVYMAIDGVAPRAKLNQQRSRRYRSGLEGQIETTIYEAHAQKLAREKEEKLAEERNLLQGTRSYIDEVTPFSMDDGYSFSYMAEPISGETTHPNVHSKKGDPLEEVSPGRFKGKFEATTNSANDTFTPHSDGKGDSDDVFHSNVITPGTPFFQDFTQHLEHFVQYKISTDPKWQKLTIIFSGPNVPGEGEHKIMDFIRTERRRPDYDPNLRHCIMGQDGDLIMLGLATHEPNLVLLRERVVFSMTKRKLAEAQAENGLDSYLHNGHFEFLHIGVLRDYLAFEFETSNILSTSTYDLEHTIDDFVFMTFFVGNDFLPHMPALDIADHAFDLLFSTYKACRAKWAEEDPHLPYLTHAGSIVSGSRLEEFLTAVGSHEVTYYDKKKQAAPAENKRIKRVFKQFGIPNAHPDERLVASKEESDRAAYRNMLLNQRNEAENEEGIFNPVMNSDFKPTEDSKEENQGLISRLGSLLKNSLTINKDLGSSETSHSIGLDDTDLKGRYYFDKFQFSPFDEENHMALRKAYIEGLVWTLKYYYEGCPSWEWYFPYHYGPMLSDLVNLDELLGEISFEGREGLPLKPFEQLLGCMPPSQAKHLPKPYRKFMTEPDSPIIDFYPESFTIDMNGKRWPWEAVTLLPFIDSKRLIEVAATIDEGDLTESERARNAFGEAIVFTHDPTFSASLERLGDNEGFQALGQCTAKRVPMPESSIFFKPEEQPPVLEPKLIPGVEVPLAGFGTLRSAPIQNLDRRNLGIDVFSSRSRYRTSCLEMSNVFPEGELPRIEEIAAKLIGSNVFVNYPYFLEGYVTAVSNEFLTIRGESEPKQWAADEAKAWKNKRDGLIRQFLSGEGVTGTGGVLIREEQPVTLSVRPFKKIMQTNDGTSTKCYAKFELEVPLATTFWSPKYGDPRLENLPSMLETDRFDICLTEALRLKQSALDVASTRGPKRLFPPRKPIKVKSSAFSTYSCTGQRFFSTDSSLDVTRLNFATAASHTSIVFPTQSEPQSGACLSRRSMVPLGSIGRPSRIGRACGGSIRGRLGAAGLMAAAVLFGAAHGKTDSPLVPRRLQPVAHFVPIHASSSLGVRGGDVEEFTEHATAVPPLEFFHGTTTLSFIFDGGIIAAVDSRASLGSFVGSKTTQKVLSVSSHILG